MKANNQRNHTVVRLVNEVIDDLSKDPNNKVDSWDQFENVAKKQIKELSEFDLDHLYSINNDRSEVIAKTNDPFNLLAIMVRVGFLNPGCSYKLIVSDGSRLSAYATFGLSSDKLRFEYLIEE